MATVETPEVAFLGLGLMGAPMARRLLADGLPLKVWNRTSDKAQAFSHAGVAVAPTPAEAATDADVVCLCLTDAVAIEAVAFGPDGFVEALRKSALVIDFSSIGVAETAGFSRRVLARSAEWLDAPVSGGAAAARSGQLTIFCGGAETAFAAAQPVLSRVGRNVTHLGGSGAGQAAKLCNQLIVSANLVAIAEAITLARILGADPQRLMHALAGGLADSPLLQVFGPRMASGEAEPKLGAIATMRKDVHAIQAAAAEGGLFLPLLQSAAEAYRTAIRLGLGDEDLSRLHEIYFGRSPPRA